jgi:hypothetical protein
MHIKPDNKLFTPDEAARYLRQSISITDVKKHRALNVLCDEIKRLRDYRAGKFKPTDGERK